MKNLLDKAAIIRLKQEGLSNRGVARSLGIDKKTVNKYWNQYKDNLQKLNETTDKTEISPERKRHEEKIPCQKEEKVCSHRYPMIE